MRRSAARDVVDLTRVIAGILILGIGSITVLYVWGRIWLPAAGLEAPSWDTWFWAVLMPVLVGAGFTAVAAGVGGKGGR